MFWVNEHRAEKISGSDRGVILGCLQLSFLYDILLNTEGYVLFHFFLLGLEARNLYVAHN